MKGDIGKRIKAARERRKVSQEKLAKAIGWNHHQIVSDVEQGNREVKAWELCEIAKFLSVDVSVLLGDQKVAEQLYVLWREKPSKDQKLLEARFSSDCENYLWLETVVSNSAESTIVFEELPKKTIDLRRFTLEQAYQFAENIRQHMGLGDFPAAQLLSVLEDRYGVKFIVEHKEFESSAACSRSEKGCFILLNGRNTESRQFFSIAHELFHLITWNQEMLKLIDEDPKLHKKNEMLANAFAAGLLIPQEKIQTEVAKICGDQSIRASDVVALAEQFQVSKDAMLYRMHNVNLLSKKEFEETKARLSQLSSSKSSSPPMEWILKSKFIRLVYLACEHVKISRMKAAKLLKIDLCELSDEFNKYGLVEVNA